MFDYFHIAIFVAAIITGIVNAGKARLLLDSKYSKNYSLEKILGIAAISLFWVFYGFYKGINSDLLTLEVFTLCTLLVAFISKLNQSEPITFFGKIVPGHGKEESYSAKKIKYFSVYFIGTAILILVVAMLLMLFG